MMCIASICYTTCIRMSKLSHLSQLAYYTFYMHCQQRAGIRLLLEIESDNTNALHHRDVYMLQLSCERLSQNQVTVGIIISNDSYAES